MKKRILSLLLVCTMLLIPMGVKADNEIKPFFALGADLNATQRATVLQEFGVTEEEIAGCNVVYVTNAQEHQYLDAYIESSVIGTHALSCVKMTATPPGSGIKVTTKNISYCTISMYRNALITAGVENADVLVVGPSQISGTAALIGVMEAYEQMSGVTLTEEAKDTAMSELVTVGSIMEATPAEDATDMQELLDYVKAEVVAGDLSDPEAIKDVIEEAEEKFGLTLTDEQIAKIVELMQKIADLDIDPSKLIEQASDLYDKYGETILKDAKAAIDSVITDEVKQSFWESVGNFFATLWDSIANFFTS